MNPRVAAALIIEVLAGVIPEHPDTRYTKRWSLSRQQARDAAAWQRVHEEAVAYMRALHDPSIVNWVRMEWIWI